jgi:small subunit ribosomal protein S8e
MKTGKKSTGGRYKKSRKKKLYEMPGIVRQVILGELKKKNIRTRGGHLKTVLLSTNIANITSKDKKAQIVKIKNVIEVPSNVFLARKNVIVKGAIIDTEKGKARVTNRPGQEGQVQAVLIN